MISSLCCGSGLRATPSDTRFDAGLDWANATIEPVLRMERLAGSEELLMRTMPIIPLYCDSYSYLQKPFVRGLPMNPGNLPLFKYAWIDTNWRPS
jgi:ABC-type oligopeptide transport system substrate-binding subunit